VVVGFDLMLRELKIQVCKNKALKEIEEIS
jgi:hypothetical protein